MVADIYSLFTGRSDKGIMAVLRDFEKSQADEEMRVVVAKVPWALYKRIDDARGADCGVAQALLA